MPESYLTALLDHELSLSSTVARELVHKAAIEQVLLSDHCATDGAFLCCGQIPRVHMFYSDTRSDYCDPLLLLEAARQAGILISHRYLGVPDSTSFIFSLLTLHYVNPDAARLSREPASLHIHLSFSKPRHRHGALVSGRMDAGVYINGTHALDTGGELTFVPAKTYRALRRHTGRGRSPTGARTPPPERANPREVARSSLQNVVVSPLRWPSGALPSTAVIVDESHASFFDHPLDHVPGALLIEALRQSALLMAARVLETAPERLLLRRAATNYEAFAELGVPITCTIQAPSSRARAEEIEIEIEIHLALEQSSQRLASGSFVFERDRGR